MVVGHRGHGMNVLQSTDKRMKAYKENSITSFNNAANHALDYIEFDVQVVNFILIFTFSVCRVFTFPNNFIEKCFGSYWMY